MSDGVAVSYGFGSELCGRLLTNVYRFRAEVFQNRLGWDVKVEDGMEIDEFDAIDPVYFISQSDRNKIQGCTRILPTRGPSMLRDVFPQLLRGELMPEDPCVWEYSRFAVTPDRGVNKSYASSHPVTFNLIRDSMVFACDNGITQYVAVMSVAFERLLKRLGLSMRRFGDGKSTMVGKVRSVACWIHVDSQTLRALHLEHYITERYAEAA